MTGIEKAVYEAIRNHPPGDPVGLWSILACVDAYEKIVATPEEGSVRNDAHFEGG
jgi:hypothetical protein